MANEIETLIEDGWQAVRADVGAALRNHPQYGQIIDAIVAKVITQLAGTVV